MEGVEQQSPVAIVVRMAVEELLSPACLDQTCEERAERQGHGQLLFSSVCDIMREVSLCMRRSVYANYLARKEGPDATAKAV